MTVLFDFWGITSHAKVRTCLSGLSRGKIAPELIYRWPWHDYVSFATDIITSPEILYERGVPKLRTLTRNMTRAFSRRSHDSGGGISPRRRRPYENPPEKGVGSDKRVSNGRWASRGRPYKVNLESRTPLSIRCSSGQTPRENPTRPRTGACCPLAGFRSKKKKRSIAYGKIGKNRSKREVESTRAR